MNITETTFLLDECPVWCDGHAEGAFPGEAHLSVSSLLMMRFGKSPVVLRRKIIWLLPGKMLIVRFEVGDQKLQVEIGPIEELSAFWTRAFDLEELARILLADYEAQVVEELSQIDR